MRGFLKGRIPFAVRIAGIFIIFIFSLLALIGLVLSIRLRGIIQTTTHDNFLKIAQARSEQVGELLDKTFCSLTLSAEKEGFLSSDIARIEETLFSLEKNLPQGVKEASFIFPDGRAILNTGGRSFAGQEPYYHALFKEKKERFISDPLISRTSQKPVVVFAHSVKDSNGQVLGALCFEVLLESLSTLVSEIQVSKTGFGWITDANGIVLAHPDPSVLMRDVGRAGASAIDTASAATEESPKTIPVDTNSSATENTQGEIDTKPKTSSEPIRKSPVDASSGATVDASSGATLTAMAKLAKKQEEEASGYILWKNSQKVETATYYAIIPHSPQWSLEISVAMKEINEPVQQSLFVLITVSIIAAAVALIVAYILASGVVTPVKRIVKVFYSLTQGDADLTLRVPIQRKDELGDLITYFNTFIEKLQEIVRGLRKSQENLIQVGRALDRESTFASSVSGELSQNVLDVNTSLAEQENSVGQTANRIDAIVKEISNLDTGVATLAANVEEASAAVIEMLKNTDAVSVSMTQTAQDFEHLENSAKAGSELQSLAEESIAEITRRSEALAEANEVIAGIASQTNLLAMNAAIEAAHAGEAGKGFAVVADEIRRLAETSSEQSRTISKYIENVQEAIKNVVNSTQQSGEAFSDVAVKIKELSRLIADVNNAMFEQKVGSSQIMEALNNLSSVAVELRDGSAQMQAGTGFVLSDVNSLRSASAKINKAMTLVAGTSERANKSSEHISESAQETASAIEGLEIFVGRFKI